MKGGSNPAFLFARRPACRQEAGRGGSCRSPQVRHAPRHADQRRPAPFRSAPGSTEHIPPTRLVCLSPIRASSMKGEAIHAQADSRLVVCSIVICIRWRFL